MNHYARALCVISFVMFGVGVNAQSTSQEWENFEVLAEYLSRGSGHWVGENENHDPSNERSPEAFGLWFERPLPALLTLKIVAYMKDTVLISSQGTFNWHPIKQQVIHSMSDRGNGYADGFTSFPNDSTFISVMQIYRPDGSSYDHKDENFIVDEDMHRNTSYAKDEDGNWVERGNWIWRRKQHSLARHTLE